MERVGAVVVGAGVIGLAIARALARGGQDVLVLEAERSIGTHTSSRNSEVVHAGLYYARGSLKATLCVAGREPLYRYCDARGIGHRRCGKLVVAADASQIGALEALHAAAHANGVDDVRLVGAHEAIALEPALHCVAALRSPSTGIVDSHALMLAYQGDAERDGATIAFGARALGARVVADGFAVRVDAGEPLELATARLVNSAGLEAPAFASRIEGLPAGHVPRAYFAKGNYFTLSGLAPFSRLVYPVPEPGGLGVHLTLDLAGQARFGPDVEWVERPDYRVDPARAAVFYAAIRRYWPGLRDGALAPGYAGVRPKIVPAGAPAGDFVIAGPDVHGVAGLVNLFGIESPGLTASLAIAASVAAKLGVPSTTFA